MLLDTQAIAQALGRIPLFEGLDSAALQDLSAQMEIVNIQGNQILMHKGDAADCLYVLLHGRLKVYAELSVDNGDKAIGEIGVGEVVGELGILTDAPRSATVKAVRDSTLVKISDQVFKTMVKSHPTSAMKMVSACITRLMPDQREKHNAIKTVALVGCEADKPFDGVASKLMDGLGTYVKATLLNSKESMVQSALSSKASNLNEVLSDIESQNDLTVYQCDTSLTDWTKLCLRQADKIILLTEGQHIINSPVLEFVQAEKNIIAERILLVGHPNKKHQPKNTRQMLDKVTVEQHFHAGDASDYERVARFLLGKSVSVVFSGGGLRGVGHHGLIRAFEEREIPIDFVGGTSFGAIVAMICGQGLNQEEMVEVWRRLIDRIKKVVDITLPITALAYGRVLYELLVDGFPEDLSVEDLWIPAFCVSANLSERDILIHDRGPVWKAIRSSLSIPGVFPPMIDGDKVLVDGASFNNLPVDIMQSRSNEGTVIASLVSGSKNVQQYEAHDQGISGWSLLFNQLRGNDPIMPNIIELMLSASLAASSRHEAAMIEKADYAFDLGVGNFKLLDADNWERIKDTGYKTITRELDRLQFDRKKLGL